MSESPVSAEKSGSYHPDQKAPGYDGEKGTPVYVDEGIAESEAIEFGETKELRCAIFSGMR
jgi:hypothetical protein